MIEFGQLAFGMVSENQSARARGSAKTTIATIANDEQIATTRIPMLTQVPTSGSQF
jgi:hypothetical protein